MRRTTFGIVGGSIAFALTAASAIGTGIVVNSVEDVRGVTSDTVTVAESLCDGTYDITWAENILGDGSIDGATATRTAPAAPDPTLPFCAGAPAKIEIYDGAVGVGTLVAIGYDYTDTEGDAVFSNLYSPIDGATPVFPTIEGGWGVRLTIGDPSL